jgi:hypothetical protein
MPITLNRNAVPVLAIFAAAGLTMTACNEQEREDAKTAVTDAATDTANAAKDAGRDVANAAVDAKDKFVNMASTQLNSLETDITDFVNKARENMPNATAEVNRVRDELNNAVAKAKVELEKVRNAGADGWEDASASFKAAMDEVTRTFNQVKAQFTGAEPAKMPG